VEGQSRVTAGGAVRVLGSPQNAAAGAGKSRGKRAPRP